MAKNYSSSDLENDLFIIQNTFTSDNYNLDISENDQFLFMQHRACKPLAVSTKNCRFVNQNVLKTVHSVV